MPRICLGIILVLILPLAAETETIRAKTIVTSYRGFLQSPAPDEDEYTIVLWKTDPLLPGLKEGVKIIFEQAVLDSIGPLYDLQFKEVILRNGTFQIIGKKIICISLESDNVISIENLRLASEEAEERLEQLSLTIEGYINLGESSLVVYKYPTGEEFLEEIKFDNKTLFLNTPYGWPREHIHQLSLSRKVRVKIGWRQPEHFEPASESNVSDNEYIAAYINISVLD
ncbi:MAG: hypothetical protein Q8R29_03275 [bacterium]|nr:hypothetical protein [bacterium]